MKEGKKLLVKMPMKKTFEKISTMQDIDEDTDAALGIEAMAELVAEILSNNMQGQIVDKDYVNENYDLEEMQLFIQEYFNFVKEAAGDPN